MKDVANWYPRMSFYFWRRFDLERGKCMAATSRMNREIHVRICGRQEVKFLWPTRRLKKNHEWLCATFAAINIYQHRKRLVPLGA
jgi:hypothetical protein